MKQNVFSRFHILIYQIVVRVIYRESKRGACLGPPFATVMCKVGYLAFKRAQQQLQCISGLVCFQRGPQQQL